MERPTKTLCGRSLIGQCTYGAGCRYEHQVDKNTCQSYLENVGQCKVPKCGKEHPAVKWPNNIKAPISLAPTLEEPIIDERVLCGYDIASQTKGGESCKYGAECRYQHIELEHLAQIRDEICLPYLNTQGKCPNRGCKKQHLAVKWPGEKSEAHAPRSNSSLGSPSRGNTNSTVNSNQEYRPDINTKTGAIAAIFIRALEQAPNIIHATGKAYRYSRK